MDKSNVSSGFSIGAEETVPTKPKKVKRNKITKRLFSSHSYDSVFGFGLVPSSFTVTAVAGTGKTTWLLNHQQGIIDYHKRVFPRDKQPTCVFISNEMKIDALAKMCDRLNVVDVDIVHLRDIDKILALFEKYDYVVIDSLPGIRVPGCSKKQEPIEATNRIVAKQQECDCCVGIIVHLTKDGKAKGDSSIGHIVDCNLSFKKGSLDFFRTETIIVNVEKNRNGPSGYVPFCLTPSGFNIHHQYVVDEYFEKDIISELPKHAFKKVV